MVDPELDGPAQHGDRLVVVARRPEHPGTGELHGAVADAGHGEEPSGKLLHATSLGPPGRGCRARCGR